MLPSDVLVTPTVAGAPVLVFGGCAVEAPPPLPQAASASTASATVAAPARKVPGDLSDIMIAFLVLSDHSGPNRTVVPCRRQAVQCRRCTPRRPRSRAGHVLLQSFPEGDEL